MQSLMRSLRNPMFWGATAIALTTIISLVVAWVYISPPNERLITFYTEDSASVRSGDTVRVAGIVVGKVKDIEIEPERVRVRVGIDRNVFIGDETQVEVRMLTVVGGYFVTLIPLGDRPLGSRGIPVEHVTMPYSLIRTLSDATKITDSVAPRPVKESLDQIQHGLDGNNAEVLTKILNAGNAVTEVMDRQRGQLTGILEMSNEFISTLNDNHELIVYLISRAAILEQSLVLYGDGFARSVEGLAEILKRLDELGAAYMRHRADYIERIRGILREFQTMADRNGALVRAIRSVRGRMEQTLNAQNAGTPPELYATDLCFPTEGSRC